MVLKLPGMLDQSTMRHSVMSTVMGSMCVLYGLITAGCQTAMPRTTSQPASQPPIVSVSENFDLPELGEWWTFRTPGQWRLASEEGTPFLQMAFPAQGAGPAVAEYASYNRYQFRSFSLSMTFRLERRGGSGPCDAFVMLGPDARNHYLIDLSAAGDADHNGVFKVVGGLRRRLVGEKVRHIPPLDGGWHRVDVLRNADDGAISVYVDVTNARDEPVLEAQDRDFEWVKIAIGSFDRADFARLLIQGEAEPLPRFRPVSDGNDP